MDVWQHTTTCDGDCGQELAQLLVISDGQLDVPWDDPGLLVIAGGISSQLEHLGGKVFQDCGQVDRCSCSNSGGVLSSLQVSCNTTDWELKSSLGRFCDGFLSALSFSSSRHD